MSHEKEVHLDKKALEDEAIMRHLIEQQGKVFPVKATGLGGADYLNHLTEAFHEANGLSKKQQLLGLLTTISHGCNFLIEHLMNTSPEKTFDYNPLPGFYFQFEEIQRLFRPVSDADIVKAHETMIDMFYVKAPDISNAIKAYAQNGVEISPVYAGEVNGTARFVLRLVNFMPGAGQGQNYTKGQLMHYIIQEDEKPVDESTWNPFYVEKSSPVEVNDESVTAEAANDFGNQPFVGAGSKPVIVSATFEEAGSVAVADPVDPQARGMTAPILHVDEFSYISADNEQQK